ncbi:Putative Ig domain-containing protein [Desulfonema limicola]|uniref:Ig domain-containing protein n=1 Tax=Desulfonema limicola TaxID=45656 RepID=A0A975GHS4_9BACT|nr:putative Ig domain-containing protein [Desulfonema limicola]QTA81747.1 Putative Ig domain-containing protein [Desulfonema limicola]
MGVISSRYFKAILLFTMLFFLWQPAWGLVKLSDPPNPTQGQGDYFVNFNNYVGSAANNPANLQFTMTASEWAFLSEDGKLSMASVLHPFNQHVGSQVTVTVTDLGESEPASVEFVLTVINANDAPVFTEQPVDQTFTEEAEFSFTVNVQDVDLTLLDAGEALIPSLSDNAPKWLSVKAGSPAADGTVILTLSGTPDEELSLGSTMEYPNVTIIVKDSITPVARVVSPSFKITVNPVDDPPKISGTPPTTVKQDELYSFKPVYTDVDTEDLTYAVTIDGNAPAEGFWLQMKNDGTLSGTPVNTDVPVPVNNIVISVSDATTPNVSLPAFNITVENKNDAPTITGTTCTEPTCENNPITPDLPVTQVVQLPQAQAGAGTTYLLELEISDIDIIDGTTEINAQSPTDISYSFLTDGTAGLPTWIEEFYPNDTDRRIVQLRNKANRPNNDDVGTYKNIQVLVTDGMGGVAKTGLFSIIVDNANDKPFFTQTPIAVIGIDEDSPVMFIPAGSAVTDTTTKVNQVKADDIDLKYGDVLAYSLDLTGVTKPENAPLLETWLGIDAKTGVFTGVPRAVSVGQYTGIKIIVTDAGGLLDEYSFDMIVKAVNDKPVFTQAPPSPSDQTIQINAGIAFPSGYNIIKATDEDSTDNPPDSVTFSFKEGYPAWLSIANTGKEEGTEIFTGEISGTPTNADAGTFDVVLIAEDNSGAVTESPFRIEVIYVNKPPVINSSMTKANWNEDSFKEISIPVIDDAGDTLTPSMSNAPAWLSYRMDGMNVILSGTPQAKDIGVINNVELIVTDASDAAAKLTFSIEVIEVNDAPVITGSLPIGVIGKAYSFKPVVTDEESNYPITFGFTGSEKPDGLSFDAFTGTISGTPTAAGTYKIIIIAYDSEGVSDETRSKLEAVLQIIADDTVIEKGDVNADGTVDLTDAIIVLQVMAGISPSASITLDADTNADGRLGLEDIIYIMNNLTAAATEPVVE